MARLWRYDEGAKDKYLVTRRDGTTPAWPHFVMGAGDPAVPAALLAYADAGDAAGFDPALTADVRAMAAEFEAWRAAHGTGDPDAPPHRTDLPLVVALMRREGDVATLAARLARLTAALVNLRTAAGAVLRAGTVAGSATTLSAAVDDAGDALLVADDGVAT